MNKVFILFFIFSCGLSVFLLLEYLIALLIKTKTAHSVTKNREEDFLMIIQTGSCKNEKYYQRKKICLQFFEYYITLSQTIKFTTVEKKRIKTFFLNQRIHLYLKKLLKSPFSFRRCIAVYYLGYFPDLHIRKLIQTQFKKEKNMITKGYFIRTLCLLHDVESFPSIIKVIKKADSVFIKRLSGLMSDYTSVFIPLFYEIKKSRNEKIVRFIIEIANLKPFRIFPDYLTSIILDTKFSKELRIQSFFCMMKYYPEILNPANFINSEDVDFENIAITFLGEKMNKKNFDVLLDKVKEHPDSEVTINSLSNMVQKFDQIFIYAKEKFKKTTNNKERKILARILSIRFEYFIPTLTNPLERQDNELILTELLHLEKFDNFITFMNQNTDIEIENKLISIIQKEMDSIDITKLQKGLKFSILEKIGIGPLINFSNNIAGKNEIIKKMPWIVLLCLIVAIPVVIVFIIINLNPGEAVKVIVEKFINTYLEIFSFYALAINCFFFFILLLARSQSKREKKFYDLKKTSLLFQTNILPSVSILAPAFCEKETIIESVTSLLNLKYPDFEIIIINDGSTDETLEILVKYFHLQKKDYHYTTSLKTSEILGIYINPDIPQLKVIDKINGGKADSLNAGINLSSKEYVLGIDSDCILESDALLHLTAPFIDEIKPVVAAGGVIMPVNGCSVQKGNINTRHISSSPLPILQTLEYYRSFMNGRIGWAKLNTLMIISGAFGIFKRDLMIKIHGYLTNAEKYKKDTVGEDMEVLIRIIKTMKEKKKNYKVLYSSAALCWTEVPATLKNLIRQRNRWQRGLMDILSFHKKIFINPKYGSYGLFGFPFFLITEVIFPWFQIFTLALFLIGLILQLIPLYIILFLIATSFILTFANTVLALFIGNQNQSIFPIKDQLKLLGWSFCEGLGFSQFSSALRISGYISVLRNIHGWKKFERRGFKE